MDYMEQIADVLIDFKDDSISVAVNHYLAYHNALKNGKQVPIHPLTGIIGHGCCEDHQPPLHLPRSMTSRCDEPIIKNDSNAVNTEAPLFENNSFSLPEMNQIKPNAFNHEGNTQLNVLKNFDVELGSKTVDKGQNELNLEKLMQIDFDCRNEISKPTFFDFKDLDSDVLNMEESIQEIHGTTEKNVSMDEQNLHKNVHKDDIGDNPFDICDFEDVLFSLKDDDDNLNFELE